MDATVLGRVKVQCSQSSPCSPVKDGLARGCGLLRASLDPPSAPLPPDGVGTKGVPPISTRLRRVEQRASVFLCKRVSVFLCLRMPETRIVFQKRGCFHKPKATHGAQIVDGRDRRIRQPRKAITDTGQNPRRHHVYKGL